MKSLRYTRTSLSSTRKINTPTIRVTSTLLSLTFSHRTKEISLTTLPNPNSAVKNYKDAKSFPFASMIEEVSLPRLISSRCGLNGTTLRPITMSFFTGPLTSISYITISASYSKGSTNQESFSVSLQPISQAILWARQTVLFIK